MNEEKKYLKPTIEVCNFQVEDVIRTSDLINDTDDGDWVKGDNAENWA